MSETKRYQALHVAELPSKFKAGIIYIEESKKVAHTIAFVCPCGCEDVIYLNLLPDAYPRWYYEKNWINRVSIYPSIKRKVGCRSHFFLRHNKIRWCEKL